MKSLRPLPMRGLAALLWLVLALGAIPARAEPWSDANRTAGVAALALTVADWAQTRYIAEHPDRFYENNRFLGEHPSTRAVDRYFIEAIAGRAAVAYFLPPHARTWWLGTVAFVELRSVTRNWQIGVSFTF